MIVNRKKNWTDWIANFAVPADHRVKFKESKKKKKNKCLELVGELKKGAKHESEGDSNL